MRQLMVEPGSHPCTLEIDGKQVQAELELLGDRRPSGTAYEVTGIWEQRFDGAGKPYGFLAPSTRSAPMLAGQLRSGLEVVLRDAQIMEPLVDHCRVTGALALCGWDLLGKDEPVFDSVCFQVGGLVELSGTAPLSEITVPIPKGTQFMVTIDPECRQRWTSGTGDELALDYNIAYKLQRGYQAGVTTSPAITATGSPRSAEQWMDEVVRPVAQVAGFATTTHQPITWVKLRQPEQSRHTVQVFAADIAQAPYDALPPSGGGFASLLHLTDDGPALPDLLHGWRRLHDTHDLLMACLLGSHQEPRSLETRFRTAVAALESYHTTTIGLGPMPQDAYKRTYKQVLRNVKASDLSDDDKQFIKDQLSSLGAFELAERLRQLHLRLPDELQQRITDRIAPLPQALQEVMGTPKDIWQVMGKIRNNLAHGNASPNQAQLKAVCLLAETLVTMIAMTELEVPVSRLAEAIDRGWWTVVPA